MEQIKRLALLLLSAATVDTSFAMDDFESPLFGSERGFPKEQKDALFFDFGGSPLCEGLQLNQ